jgi:hypothetical protein
MSIAVLGGARGSARTATGTTPAALTNPLTSTTRSIEMNVMHQELLRAHISERHREAERIRRVQRVVSARRAQRKAEKAILRARLAALAIH